MQGKELPEIGEGLTRQIYKGHTQLMAGVGVVR